MEFHKAKKVVIVTEATIVGGVIKIINELGASGYTVQDATGKGERGGVRSGKGPTDLFKNVRIEAIANEEIARKIAVEMVERFFKTHAGIVYIEDVEVIRAKKFNLPE